MGSTVDGNGRDGRHGPGDDRQDRGEGWDGRRSPQGQVRTAADGRDGQDGQTRRTGVAVASRPNLVRRGRGRRDRTEEGHPEGALVADLEQNLEAIRARLGVGVSFDALIRELQVAERRAALVFIDGFVKDDVTSRLMGRLLRLRPDQIEPEPSEKLKLRWIPYFEVAEASTVDELTTEVLSGQMALLIDGEATALLLDLRQYPARSIEEPDLERVTRGSREGFVETAIFNTVLVRRRLRDPKLRWEALKVGLRSKTDVFVGYIEGVADPSLVEEVKRRIQAIKADAIPMGSRSLEEYLLAPRLNPLPRVRVTERPDVVAAHLTEGYVAVVVDTTPGVMILPANLWHFTQHAEEYFQHPTVGTYLRWVRFSGMLVSLLLVPLWLALATSRQVLPEGLRFLGPKEGPTAIPLWLQLVLLYAGIDLVRSALIHTPSALAASLGIIGAILLGQFAVEVGWFVPETILYAAIAAIGFFTTPSLEFALALRLFSYGILFLTAAFGLVGLGLGVALTVVTMAFTRSFGMPYLWPLFPFNGKALRRLLLRSPIPAVHTRPVIATQDTES